jgi:predicted nucleic acid-binding protein
MVSTFSLQVRDCLALEFAQSFEQILAVQSFDEALDQFLIRSLIDPY